MPFEKGKSGNPGGRAAVKPWRDALMVAVNRKAAKFTIDTLVEMLSRIGKPVRVEVG